MEPTSTAAAVLAATASAPALAGALVSSDVIQLIADAAPTIEIYVLGAISAALAVAVVAYAAQYAWYTFVSMDDDDDGFGYSEWVDDHYETWQLSKWNWHDGGM